MNNTNQLVHLPECPSELCTSCEIALNGGLFYLCSNPPFEKTVILKKENRIVIKMHFKHVTVNCPSIR